jgi:hypothetical protein
VCFWQAGAREFSLWYVDDSLIAHTRGSFSKILKAVKCSFVLGKEEVDVLQTEFLGLTVSKSPDGETARIDCADYEIDPVEIEKGEKHHTNESAATAAETAAFRTTLGRLSWATCVVLRALAGCSILASRLPAPAAVKAKTAENDEDEKFLTVGDIKELNSLVADTSDQKFLEFHRIAPDDLAVVCLCDSSLFNRADGGTTQGGGASWDLCPMRPLPRAALRKSTS